MQPTSASSKDWRSSGLIIKLTIILLIGAIVIVAILRDRLVNTSQWTVSIVGEGKVAYESDTAVVLLGVQIDKALTAEKALIELNSRIEKITEAIKKSGVSEEDISTRGFSVYTHYDFIDNVSRATGYDANQQLAVKLRNIKDNKDLISQVINDATNAGVNRVDSVTFELSNLENLKQQARLLAIADAKSKAGVLATASGVKLKKVVGWWENLIQAPGVARSYYYYDGIGGSDSSGSGSVSNGLQEIIIEVNLNYQIK